MYISPFLPSGAQGRDEETIYNGHWIYAHRRLSLLEAFALSGLDPALSGLIICNASVDACEADGQYLISKESLWEYPEIALEVAHELWG